MGYTKLHDDILRSSIWVEDDKTLRIWIGFLAMANMDGIVSGSVPGTANVLRVTVEELEAALAKFMSPDRYSRTKDLDGRRIVEVDGGWQLVTHARHRARCSPEEKRAKNAARQRVHRAKLKEGNARNAERNDSHARSLQAEAEAEAEAYTPLPPTVVTPPLSLESMAEKAFNDGEGGWQWAPQPLRDAIVVCWDGWRAWTGKANEPVPKSYNGCKAFLRCIMDGRTPEQIRDRLAGAVGTEAHKDLRNENPGFVLAHWDKLEKRAMRKETIA